MKTHLLLALLLACSSSLLTAAPLGTAFTYQGQLADAGQPAHGVFDLRFVIYDAPADGAEVGAPLTNAAVAVNSGLFTSTLDFGSGVFTGDARWLEIGVRPTGVGAFTVLSPRQPLTSAPYALSAGSVPGGTITTTMLANGAVTSAKIAPGAVSQLGTPNGADTNAVQVTNGGLVGIGTSTPQAGLHLTSGRDLFAPTWLAELVDNRNSWFNLAGNCRVATSGNLLAVASFSDDALTLIDITTPAAPTRWWSVTDGTGAFTNLNGPSGLALSGSLLAVAANAESAVTLVDISDPAARVHRSVIRDGVGGFNDLNGAFAVDLTGPLLAVAAVNDHAVSLVDVADPTNPTLVGLMKDGFNGFDDLASPVALARQGNLLAIAAFSDNAVTLVDVSRAAAPARLATLRQGTGGFTNLTGPMAVALSGRLLAIAAFTDNAVTLVDISDPARPLRQATLRDGQGGFDNLAGPSALQFQGDILWIAAPNDAALTAVDVSKPTTPALKGVLRDGSAGFNQLADLRSLAAAGNTLVAGAVSAVTLLDATPVQVGLVSEGRVGIGTATPEAALHVVGNLTVEGAGLARLQAVHVELGASTARGNYATALGSGTMANGDYSLAGGRSNVVEAAYSAIVAGLNNSIGSDSAYSFIGGGRDNVVETHATNSVIVGGEDNFIVSTQRAAFIGGGARNGIRADNEYAVIVGGRDNRIGTNNVISLVVGGAENEIGNNVDGGLMVGGFRNDIFGSKNPDRRQIAPVLMGGSDNKIDCGYVGDFSGSSWAVILGGDNNRIGTNCPSAVIVGGTNNLVAASSGYSFAAGRRCRVDHMGSFMWADSQNASFHSAAENSFNIRAEGGVRLNADTSQFFGSSFRQVLNLYGANYGIGVQELTHYARTTNNGSFSWYAGGSHVDTTNSPGAGGVEMMRLNSGGLRVNGTFVSASDRNQKQNLQPVEPRAVLEKVAALPIAEWSFKQDAETRHVGPMAQDFRAAFGLGTDDKHIATVDADGVALAAIQGLNQRLNEKEAEIRELKRAVAELQAALGTASVHSP